MNKEASEYVARVVFKATAELALLVPLIRDHASSDEEYEALRKSLTAIARMANDDLLENIFLQYPEIKEVFDNSIRQFKRLP